ncbi:MAG: HRDC domain-containing protein, partial [Rhizobiales bacterium]|nr:HRDC domain-containing protein [Hyphomicrobiales bacterium]
ETGRAGRDGQAAETYMIYGMDDAAMQRGWINNSDATQNQKRIEHQKLDALLGLCEAVTCRRQILLKYFGDSSEACGNCDTCQTKPETFDGTITAQKALSCVHRTGQRFGVGYLTDILLGKDDERIKGFGHDKQSTFGIGTEHDKKGWQNVFRQLVAQNLLVVDIAGHGGLSVTENGGTFLREKNTILLRKPPKQTTAKKYDRPSKKAGAEFENDQDKDLYELLKGVRAQIAKTKKLPAYVIFHDRTLIELASQKPQSLNAMLAINGIGETKLERYGEAFLELITNDAEGR